jgi:hypothetical protein
MLEHVKKGMMVVVTLALGSRPRQGLVKMRAKCEARESHFIFLGVCESVREWTPAFPNEFLFWELESRWTPKLLRSNFKHQNPMDWKVPYIIGKLLELKFLKWAHMTHFDTLNTTYGQKKGRKSNCQFDSQPLKIMNRPDFLVFMWRATYHWIILNKATTLL